MAEARHRIAIGQHGQRADIGLVIGAHPLQSFVDLVVIGVRVQTGSERRERGIALAIELVGLRARPR